MKIIYLFFLPLALIPGATFCQNHHSAPQIQGGRKDSARNSFTINVKFDKALSNTTIALVSVSNRKRYNNSKEQVAQLENGVCSFHGSVKEPVWSTLRVRSKNISAGGSNEEKSDDIAFMLENREITVTAKDSLKSAVITGSPLTTDNNKLQSLIKAVQKKWDPIEYANRDKPREEQWKIFGQRDHEIDSLKLNYIRQHRDSYLSLLLFMEIPSIMGFEMNEYLDLDPEIASPEFNQFTPALKNTPLGKRIDSLISVCNKVPVGSMAPDFAQNTPDGKEVKLSAYKGKYVLLDFWASWCDPCRKENPNVLAAYAKYKAQNFTVLSVSIDDKAHEKDWINAIKEDKLPWTQISDLKGRKNEAYQMYGVHFIPNNFLIDPQGKVIARHLRGEALDKKLQELFK